MCGIIGKLFANIDFTELMRLSIFLDVHLIGPLIYHKNLTSSAYLGLLKLQIIPSLLHIFSEDKISGNWYQQDGCPSHNFGEIQIFLKQTDHRSDTIRFSYVGSKM